ncbi:cell division protein FtsQ/DivIB [Sanguibacter suaedae]|uniref:Cell division protein FtsQ/DivIB n=1 Tax=Sanguibacter suaedae TaxID=2795737 RepID=A0A934IBP5_9MICO|nr:cell division protein FtsQ/DivIB [Sanguibacter suaedae]MBI9115462.1 cell division protein FtsQ/DivIB [Sanguibacter suaedae]
MARRDDAGQDGAVVPVVRSLTTAPTNRVPVLSTGMAERLAEQRAMRRHRIVRRIGLGAVAALVLGGALWVLLYSELLSFDTDHLAVNGTGSSVDPVAIREVVSQEAGTSLALLDTVRLRDQILAVPNVRDVDIARQWPSGLRVDVEAREPVVAVPVEGGAALLDRDAVEVARVDSAPPELPVIDIPLTGDDRRTVEAALVVLNSLPEGLAAEVASISAASQDAVTLTLRDGVVVEWGSSQDSALKVRVLETLRTAEVSRGAAVFDVSAPTFPITR